MEPLWKREANGGRRKNYLVYVYGGEDVGNVGSAIYILIDL